ncbi:MAG: hypothetical protein ABEJ89_04385 [Haloarculaceae archaeon]
MREALLTVPDAVSAVAGAPRLLAAGALAGVTLGAVVVATAAVPFLGPLFFLGVALPVALAAFLGPVTVAIDGPAVPLSGAVRERFAPLAGTYLLIAAAVGVVGLLAALAVIVVAGPGAVQSWVAEWGVSGRVELIAVALLAPFALAALVVLVVTQFAGALVALGVETGVGPALRHSAALARSAPGEALLALLVRDALAATPMLVAWFVLVAVGPVNTLASVGLLALAAGAAVLLWAAHHATYVRRRVGPGQL